MNKSPKIAEMFNCNLCNYTCSKKSEWYRHSLTSKHKNRTNLDNLEPKIAEIFNCKTCYKTYTARNSLWYHEKKCSNQAINLNETNTVIENDVNLKELFKLQLNENKELKDMILEQSKLMMENIFLLIR